jgi:hypothetical protein
MGRLNQSDIMIELVELAGDLMSEVRQQLLYFRASVYKDETARQIRASIERLRTISDLIGADSLAEAFEDHDEMLARGVAEIVPGECSFSKRTVHLLGQLELAFFELNHGLKSDFASLCVAPDFHNRFMAFKGEIVSMCRYGSKHWSFFQTFKD